MRLRYLMPLTLLPMAALFAYSQTAPTTAKSPDSAVLAVISIQQVYDALDERADTERELDNLRQGYTKDIDQRKAEIEKLTSTLDHSPFKTDSIDYRKLQDDLLDKTMTLQATSQIDQQKLSLEARRRMLLIHQHINEAISVYAQANNIALVLISDEPNPSSARTAQDVQVMMVARKVAYTKPAFDITRAIKEKMNIRYNLGHK